MEKIFFSACRVRPQPKKRGNLYAGKLCNIILWSGALSTMKLLNTVDSKSKRMNMITFRINCAQYFHSGPYTTPRNKIAKFACGKVASFFFGCGRTLHAEKKLILSFVVQQY